MATIAECLLRAAQLAGVSDSPRLDLEVLLAAALGRDRTYLYTWPQRPLSDAQQALFDMHLARRREGCPIAYITGEKEFWSLSLKVDSHTLIPRPETELLVERALQLLPPGAHAVADLGTGSGAIALALASERPRWQLLALDKSAAALALAESNRRRLGRVIDDGGRPVLHQSGRRCADRRARSRCFRPGRRGSPFEARPAGHVERWHRGCLPVRAGSHGRERGR